MLAIFIAALNTEKNTIQLVTVLNVSHTPLFNQKILHLVKGLLQNIQTKHTVYMTRIKVSILKYSE